MKAEELMRKLEANPEWVAERQREESERQEIIDANKWDSRLLRDQLATVGFDVEAVADLYDKRMNYERAVPILLHWLPRIENRDVKEDVVRALTVPWARPAAAPLMLQELQRMRDSDDGGLRFAVANALSEVADDSVFEEIVELARDPRLPVAERGVLTLALGRMGQRRKEAIQVLRGLLREDVAPHALTALGDLRAREVRHEIAPFLNHAEAWVQKEAKKALKKVDRPG